jgi:ATP dependent DNA ligase C terminal region
MGPDDPRVRPTVREQGLEGWCQAAAEHLPAGPADQELAQDQALPARDVPGRRLRPRPGTGQVLLVGLPDPERPGRLRFAGRVDHGLVPAARRRVLDLLGPLITPESLIRRARGGPAGGRWARPGPGDPAPVFVRPEVAVEVSFLGWESGRLRHPAYGGLSRIL